MPGQYSTRITAKEATETDWKTFLSKATPCTFEIPPGVDVALVYAAALLTMAYDKKQVQLAEPEE